MPRKRMLSPEFFTSRTLNDLPMPTMLTFAGLWCHADDAGRADDDEVMVKAAVWPRRKQITEAKVRDHLDALTAAGVLCHYEVNGYPLLHVVAWSEHQKINHPTPSKLPPCQEHEPEAWIVYLENDDPALGKFHDPSRAATGGLPEDSGRSPSQSSSVQIRLAKSKKGSPGTSAHGGDLGLVSHG